MIRNTATTLALALTMLGSSSAAAQDETAPDAAQPPAESTEDPAAAAPDVPMWLMSCSNQMQPQELLCEFSQSIVLTQGNQSQRVATASFTRVAGQAGTNADFTLPFGVSLPDGVSVLVDGNQVGTLDWQSCDAGGCYASGPVDDGWLQAMRAGEQMTAALKGRDGRDLNFSFQLTGFSKAEEMLP